MNDEIIRINTIHDLHEFLGHAKEKHPLVSLIDMSVMKLSPSMGEVRFVPGFYTIFYKDKVPSRLNIKYGREYYDFQEGTVIFIAPEQAVTFDSAEEDDQAEGWGLFFHPDLIRKSALGKKIREYTFFGYETSEALHLSEEERKNITEIAERIEREYTMNLDVYSNDVIISGIELLLNYCKRYYGRQFITRENRNKDKVGEFEEIIAEYFDSKETLTLGLPSVKYLADQMNLSPNYLSDLLRKETGKGTLDHIHYHVIEKAKTLLLSSDLTVQEIAYELGFEHPQSFTKIFKLKTGYTPSGYRRAG
jgi:AraC-like DNA-binding protein